MQILLTNLAQTPLSLDFEGSNGEMIREYLLSMESVDVGERITPEELNRTTYIRSLTAAEQLAVQFIGEDDDLIPVPGSSSGSGYNQFQNSSMPVTQRTTANFRNGLQVTDSGGISQVEPAYGGAPPAVAAAGSAGVADTISRSDHTHAHGSQVGGTLHADVVASGASGFMTGADKSKLDGIAAGAQSDHGGLSGLGDDDHTQYTLASGARAFTGDQSFGSNRATSVADPTGDQDATTRLWTLLRSVRRPVRVATAAALAAYTRVSNVITANANGALAAVDGVSLSVSNRLLLKDGAAGADNGIYTVTVLGDGSNPFVLTREDDADASNELFEGAMVWVRAGTANGLRTFVLQAFAGTLNTDAQTWGWEVPSATATALGAIMLANHLGGTAAAPTVTGFQETGGPTSISIGAVADLQRAARIGSSYTGVWELQYRRDRVLEIWDDFLHTTAAGVGHWGWNNTGTGAGAGTANQGAGTNYVTNTRLGVIESQTGSTGTGHAPASLGITAGGVGFIQLSTTQDTYFATEERSLTLSSGAQEYLGRAGLHDNPVAAGAATDGLYIDWTSAAPNNNNYRAISVSNGSSTTLDLSVAPTAATWMFLEISLSGGTATFFVAGVSRGTISTNIPTGAGRILGLLLSITKTNGTNNLGISWDYAYLRHMIGGAR